MDGTAHNEEPRVTIEQVCETTQTGRQFWYQAVKSGKLPHERFGTRIRLKWSDIHRFLESQAKAA